MFKKYLTDLSSETGLEIHVCHYPPGTSKYNKIEHRLFAQLSVSMQAHPLISMSVFQNLIQNTTTSTGLIVICMIDENTYAKSQKIAEKQFRALPVTHDTILGNWNYKIAV